MPVGLTMLKRYAKVSLAYFLDNLCEFGYSSSVRNEFKCKPGRVSRVVPGRIAQCTVRVETGSLLGYH